MTWTPWNAKPLPLPSNSRPEPIEGRAVVVRLDGSVLISSTHVAGTATRGSGYRICVGKRAGDRQCHPALNGDPVRNRETNLPALFGFGRAIQSLQKSVRGLCPSLHYSLFPPAPTGFVALSDTHRDSERNVSCVTSLVTGTTKCV